MTRSCSPKTNHDGIVFQAGVSVGSGPVRATSVADRCVARMSAARASGTSRAKTSWKVCCLDG
jgi:hypothetical protein